MFDYSEILLALGAVVLFSIVAVNTNRMLANHNRVLVESELEYAAVAKGQEIVDRAKSLAFDETTVGGNEPANIPADFTIPDNLGTASDSDSTGFDDFDDYHNYAAVDTTANGIFQVTAAVSYVAATNTDSTVGYATTRKHMAVTVSSPFLSDSIRVEFLKTYYR